MSLRRPRLAHGLRNAHNPETVAEFFLSYGLFALKTLTVVALIGVLIALVVGLLSRSATQEPDHFEITKLNDRILNERELLGGALLDDAGFHLNEKLKKADKKREKKALKKKLAAAKKKGTAEDARDKRRPQVFVVDFDGDLSATAVAGLRRELSAILSLDTPVDEVVVRLESGGGLVHAYGLAASQLDRVKAKGIKLTVCVDKVAASGGYMMACVADQILAAPFAVIGSIGVVAQIPNFYRLLKKHDVDVEVMTAGDHKRTLTVLGENTPEKREMFQKDLELTHGLFKEFVSQHRPAVDIEKVATGEVWYGQRAVAEHLVDTLCTSDEYIIGLCESADVAEVHFEKKKSIQDKITSALEASAERVLARVWQRATDTVPSARKSVDV